MATSSSQPLLAQRYRVIRRLGSGGMATVFLAQDERLGRQVAVKRLHADSPEEMAIRFEREAKVGASLNHPNLVAIYDTVPDPEGVLIVMEYVEGETLAQALQRGRMQPEEALEILSGVADALDYAHKGGVVHRDVKPANVLIGKDGRARLADLGIAYATERTHLTKSGAVLGTPSYMAPEQLESGDLGPATDVYALAAVAFEAFSGRKARQGRTPLEIAHKVATEPPPDLRDAWPEAPPELAEALTWGMASDPRERPSSAGKLVRRLAGSLPTEDRPALAGEPTERRDGAGAAGAAAAGGVAGAAAGAAAAEAAEPESHPDPTMERASAEPEAEPAPPEPTPRAAEPTPAAPDRTPAAAEPTPPQPTPKPSEPAATPPQRSHTPPPRTPPPAAGRAAASPLIRGRARPAWLGRAAALVLVLLLAGGILAAVLAGGDGGEQSADDRSSGAQQQQRQQTEQEPAPSVGGEPGTPTRAVVDFYTNSANGDTDAAWALLTPTAQSQLQGREAFERQQSSVEKIEFSQVEVTNESGNTATVSFRDVATHESKIDRCQGQTEMVRQGGDWKINRFRNISCQTSQR